MKLSLVVHLVFLISVAIIVADNDNDDNDDDDNERGDYDEDGDYHDHDSQELALFCVFLTPSPFTEHTHSPIPVCTRVWQKFFEVSAPRPSPRELIYNECTGRTLSDRR